RAEYERHLGDCAECTRALRDLAGLPGLLGRVRPEVVEQLQPVVEPLPPTLLPAVVAQARRSRGRRRAVALAAVAAVLALLAAVGIGTALRDDTPDDAPTLAAAQRMESLGTESSGWVSLTERGWGTRIDLTCT